MNENVKRYKGVATLYMIFSFIPFLFIIDQSDNISYMPAIIILVLSQFILTFFGSDSKIFYEFNSYIANAYKVKDFDIDPRELKNTDLTGYVFTVFGYMIPLFCTIQMIDIYSVEEQLGPGQIGALFNFIYLLIILFFYIIRLTKQIKYMDESYPEDAIWTQARWDARKLYLDLTLNNHSLHFTPGRFKDSTFMEFKELITEKVENLKLYNNLDSDKQVILKRIVVASVCTYLSRKCADLYVDSGN